MSFYKYLNKRTFNIILAFFKSFKIIDKVFTNKVWFIITTKGEFSTLAIKIKDSTWNLIDINSWLTIKNISL